MGFRLVILEEAAQQALPNALVALTRGAEAAVLVGDSRQLPPVANNISRDHVRSFEWGLFPRLEILQAAESHRLTRQHRMPPELSAFISGHFYPDFSLSNAPTVKEHALVSLDDVRRVKVPAFGLGSRDALVSVHVPRVKGLHGSTEPRVVAVHVDGTMQQAGTSKENWKEGAVVAALVLKLLSGDAGSRWIAVLAYHVPQVWRNLADSQF